MKLDFDRLSKNELLTGAFSSLVFRVLGLFAGYLFIVLAVRKLGVESYGVFSLSLAFLQISAMVGRLGVEFSIVKHVAQYTSETLDYGRVKEVYLKGLKVIMLAGSLLTLFVYFSSDIFADHVFKMEGLGGSLRFISFGIIPSIIYFYNGNALRGLKKPGWYSLVINFLVFFSAGIFLFTNPFPEVPNLLSLIYVSATVIAAVISTGAWLKFSRLMSSTSTTEVTTREIISTSIPMLLSGAFIIFNGWIDTLLLGILSTEKEVGIFHVLLKLAAIANIFVFAVNSIATPKYAQLGSPEKRGQLQQQVMRSNKLIALLNVPVILGLLILYKPILRFLGSDFPPETYGLALLFLCIGRFVNSFCGSGGQLLNMTGYERINQNVTIVVFVINIMLNLVLISNFGLFGAAFANMISNILRNVGYVIFIKLKLNINAIYNPFEDIRYALTWRRE